LRRGPSEAKDSVLKPGTHLGPYEIVAPIGAGGMGEVYRARDTRLGRDVAIKVLPADFASDPDRLRRFEQEARAVAALDHPNILALYDVGTHEGAPYIVTQLLEGENLRERLSGGAMPVRKAVETALQVAQGLAAAHEKGIVHRDLKPANVFVTKDGQAKILDFGIAKLVRSPVGSEGAAAPTLVEGTDPGLVMGTAGYMSPEQVRGLPVDHRSDIFSLGGVLYEMVTGRRAFARATAADTMSAILSDEPPEPSGIAKTVPAALSRAIVHCLEKQPEERYQSARDLAFELRAILADTGGTGPRAGLAGSSRRRITWLATVGVAAVLIAVGVVLVLRSTTHAPKVALEPKRIVVAVFENQTGDKSLDPLGRMASDWISQGLSRVPQIEVVPTSAVIGAEQAVAREAGAGSHADPLRLLADQTGAGTVVSGSYYVEGQALQFQAKVTDAAHRTLIYAAEPVSGPRSSPMQVLEALRERILGVVAVQFSAELSPAIERGKINPLLARPPLFEAYREYVAGIELFGEDYTQAIRHFEKAAEIDPDFLSPRVWIAVAYGNQGHYARADAIVRKINENRERLTPYERLILDWYRASLAGHNAEALDTIRRVRALSPGSHLATYLVGDYALAVNRPQETVEAFTKEAPPGFFDVHTVPGSWHFTVLARAYHMLGEYEHELELADRAIRTLPDLVTVRNGKVRALAALGRTAELDAVIDESLGVQSRAGTPGDLMLQASWELRVHGHRDDAVRMATRAADWLRGRPPAEKEKEEYHPALANALYAAERWEEARALFEQLSAEHPVASGYKGPPEAQLTREDEPDSLRISRAIDYLGALGAVAARRGDRAEALRISDRLAAISGPFLYGSHTYWRADITALLGEKQRAVDLLREAFAQGYSYDASIHQDMDLEPLWNYGPFRELLKPKG
jgi:tetratricopeptide (TPR) repeat protein/TolB-like protein